MAFYRLSKTFLTILPRKLSPFEKTYSNLRMDIHPSLILTLHFEVGKLS
jgi:hypothetical protein